MTILSLHNVFIFVMERQEIRVMERRFFLLNRASHLCIMLYYDYFWFFSNEVVVGLEVVGCLKV